MTYDPYAGMTPPDADPAGMLQMAHQALPYVAQAAPMAAGSAVPWYMARRKMVSSPTSPLYGPPEPTVSPSLLRQLGLPLRPGNWMKAIGAGPAEGSFLADTLGTGVVGTGAALAPAGAGALAGYGFTKLPGVGSHPAIADVGQGALTGAGIGTTVGLLGGPFDPITVPGGALVGGLIGGGAGLLSSIFGGKKGGEQLTGQAALQAFGATPDTIANARDMYDRIKKVRGKATADQYMAGVVDTAQQTMLQYGSEAEQTNQDLLIAQGMGKVLQPFLQESASNVALARQAALDSGQPELAHQYQAWGREVANSYATQALMFGVGANSQSAAGGGASNLFSAINPGSQTLVNQGAG